ncbi:MAG: hypothetical protein ACYC5Y_04955 [Symbiobacteriia bacterium]
MARSQKVQTATLRVIVDGAPSEAALSEAIRFLLQVGTNDSAAPKDGAAADPYSVVSLADLGGARPIPGSPLQALSATPSYPGRP